MADERTVGGILSERRIALSKTVREVAEETKIIEKFILALEEDNFAALPGAVTTKGFLRIYGRHLGLRGKELVRIYNEMMEEKEEEAAEVEAARKDIFRRSMGRSDFRVQRSMASHAMTALAFAVAFLIFIYGIGQAKDFLSAPPAKERVKVVQKQKVSGAKLKVYFSGRSWTSVMVDGKKAFEGVCGYGKQLSWNGKKVIRARFGNGGAVQANFNGRNLGVIGRPKVITVVEYRAPGKVTYERR